MGSEIGALSGEWIEENDGITHAYHGAPRRQLRHRHSDLRCDATTQHAARVCEYDIGTPLELRRRNPLKQR